MNQTGSSNVEGRKSLYWEFDFPIFLQVKE